MKGNEIKKAELAGMIRDLKSRIVTLESQVERLGKSTYPHSLWRERAGSEVSVFEREIFGPKVHDWVMDGTKKDCEEQQESLRLNAQAIYSSGSGNANLQYFIEDIGYKSPHEPVISSSSE